MASAVLGDVTDCHNGGGGGLILSSDKVSTIGKPIVDDDCEPFDLSVFSAPLLHRAEVGDVSLADLFRASWHAVGIGGEANPAILKQLPSLPRSKRDRFQVTVIDATHTYLGNRGCAALIPVIQACPRLTHVFLPRQGLRGDVAKALIDGCLMVHPSIRCVDLRYNHLGCDVGKRLLAMVQKHRQIFSLQLAETLILPQIHRRIEKQLASNEALKQAFAPAPFDVPEEDEDPSVVAARKLHEAETKERQRRAEELRAEVADRLPAWASPCIAELERLLAKHAKYFLNVVSVFQPCDSSSFVGSTPPSASFLPVTASGFRRGLQILGFTSLLELVNASEVPSASTSSVSHKKAAVIADAPISGSRLQRQQLEESHLTEVASWFGAVVAPSTSGASSSAGGTAVINVMTILQALRPHALLRSPSQSVAREWVPRTADVRLALDTLFDARETLLRSLEALDIDMESHVPLSAILNGIADVLRDASSAITIIAAFVELAPDAVVTVSSLKKSEGSDVLEVDKVAVPVSSNTACGRRILVDSDHDVPIRYHSFFDALTVATVTTDSTEPPLPAGAVLRRSDLHRRLL